MHMPPTHYIFSHHALTRHPSVVASERPGTRVVCRIQISHTHFEVILRVLSAMRACGSTSPFGENLGKKTTTLPRRGLHAKP